MTTALSKVKDMMALLFNGKNHVGQLIDKLIRMFVANLSSVRPGRSFKRDKQKRKRYNKAYFTL